MTRSGGSPLLQLTLMRFREFVREPEAVFWVLFFPILLAAVLGIAFRDAGPARLKVAAGSAQIAQALARDPLLDVRRLSPTAADRALEAREVVLSVQPHGGGVAYRYDPASADGSSARLRADRAIQRAAGQTDPAAAVDLPAPGRTARYIDFLVPGLVAMSLTNSAVWGAGVTIIDARRRKLLKRLKATPMQRWAYLTSYLVYRLLLTPIEVGAILAFAAVVFHVPLRGDLVGIVLACVLTTLAGSGLGLLVASRARTIEAANGLPNLVVLPMWLASGVFFSASQFPQAVRPLINALPLTAAVDALRASLLHGAALAQIAPQLGVLAAWALLSTALALAVFRWS
jgi:ABC-type polysaccharide/polyol phosphate export permease